ncbi:MULTISPECIES: amidohydrolase [unclassified Paraburkholderia]|uniref:amidohydrolase n=1 Tax=unclassified Paraburkholderia TaxID=2615204 RepID=UPI002AB1E53A|nr:MULTISPECIES: amidohydrolase [unclassified Paraburkholderia]
MSKDVHFGCACCAPHFIPPFDLDTPQWKERIAALPKRRPSDDNTAVLFHGGAIYPDPTKPDLRVEAIGIAGHEVIAIGSLHEVRHLLGSRQFHERKLRCEQTLLPGLIDPHAHLMTSALVKSWVDLSPFDGQELRSDYGIDYIEVQLKAALEKARIANKKWVSGFGVDPSLMKAWFEIDAEWLDTISKDLDIGIFLLNASGHISYVNTVALTRAGIEKTYPQGVLTEEKSTAVSRLLPVSDDEIFSGLKAVFAEANQRGITTIFDAGLGMLNGPAEVELMRSLAKTEVLTVRVGAALYGNKPAYLACWLAMNHPELDSKADELFSVRAIKLIADGSNQGLTGFQGVKYKCCDIHKVPGVGPYGLFNFEPARRLAKIMQKVADAGWPILTHANGDEGIANVLSAYQLALNTVNAAGEDEGPAKSTARHRVEHASLLHDGALLTMKQMGVSPSFLIGHVGYWGKAFRDVILGEKRADLLDRCASALAAGMRISLHSDHFVTPFGPLRCMEQSIGRVMEATRASSCDSDEEVLNVRERLSVQQALRAVTIDAAWQCHLDHQIGSLLPGKQADFVILEQNPLHWHASDAAGMRDIVVLETWVSGRKVFGVLQ